MNEKRSFMKDDVTKFANVLRFLNGAQSPEELAKLFPGDAQAGRKIAAAILAQKNAVGGMFTSHEQVASLSLVGPEGLTLIEQALGKLGVAPPQIEKERQEFVS